MKEQIFNNNKKMHFQPCVTPSNKTGNECSLIHMSCSQYKQNNTRSNQQKLKVVIHIYFPFNLQMEIQVVLKSHFGHISIALKDS